ncbi:hypothetical protein MMC31_003032 [Peltigera leucophlebia]|nr:hypothetical protein [Peltigera leucophlebia]
MTQFDNTPDTYNSSPDWFFFDHPPDHNPKPDLNHTSPASQGWYEELPESLSPATWLKRADARLDGRAASWAGRTAEVIRFLFGDTMNNATVRDKNTFVRLLTQEFPGNHRDAMTEEQASTELSTLSQMEDEDHHSFYRRTETLFIRISGRDRVTHDGADTVTLNRAERCLPSASTMA